MHCRILKRIFLTLFLFSVLSSQAAAISSQQAWNILNKVWIYMTTTDLLLDNITERWYESDIDYHSERSDMCYKLHNGILRKEINRGYDRKAVIIDLCPPAIGYRYWHEDKNLLDSSGWPAANKILAIPAAFFGWTTALYGMIIPERFQTGTYSLESTYFDGRPAYLLTALYPDIDLAPEKVPFSHTSNPSQNFNEREDILDQRYPAGTIPTGQQEWMLKKSEFYQQKELFRRFSFKKIVLTIAADEKKPALYGLAYYSQDGKLLKRQSWTPWEMKMDEREFRQPEGSIRIDTNFENFGTNILDSYGYAPGKGRKAVYSIKQFFLSIGKYCGNAADWVAGVLESFWVWLLEYGIFITLPIAVIAIGTVVVLKIRQNRG